MRIQSTKESRSMANVKTSSGSGYLWDERKWFGIRMSVHGASKEMVIFKCFAFEWHHFLYFKHCLRMGSLGRWLWDEVRVQDLFWSFLWGPHPWKGGEGSKVGQRETTNCDTGLSTPAQTMAVPKLNCQSCPVVARSRQAFISCLIHHQMWTVPRKAWSHAAEAIPEEVTAEGIPSSWDRGSFLEGPSGWYIWLCNDTIF